MKRFVFGLLFLGTVSFAADVDHFYYDDQPQLKEAFERAQAAHNLKEMSSTFSRPTMLKKDEVNKKNLGISSQIAEKFKFTKKYIADQGCKI